MPNGADAERRGCRTARMPNGADAEVREMPEGALKAVRCFRAVWRSAQSGIPRCLAFGAVWHLAPSGIPRL